MVDPEIPRDETANADGLPTERQAKATNRFNLIKTEKRVSAGFSILYKLFVISLILAASIFVFRELSDDRYHINQVNVPGSFEEAGLSGVVVANLIQDRLDEIIELLRKHGEAAQYINSTDLVDVQVDMVGMGVPIRGVISFIGDALGFRRGKKINADVVAANGQASLILRVSGRPAEWIDTEMKDADVKKAANELVDGAAKLVLKYTDPRILELYYANVKHDGPNTVKMARYMMENFPDDQSMVIDAYESWAWGLLYEGKLDEATLKVEEALRLYPGQHKLYNVWGNILSEQGRSEEAIAKFKKVLEMVTPSGLTDYRRVTIYVNSGISYAYLGKYDSALQYLQDALKIDKNDWIIYYDIAGVKLMQNDTAGFYEFFERSLEKGADVEMIRSDPDIKPMMGSARLEDLLTKFEK